MKDHTTYPGIIANREGRTSTSLLLCLLAMITLSVLAACGGSGGGSSTTLTAPLGAGIDENLQRNPANVINLASANGVEVEVVLGPEVNAGDLVTVRLSDGATEVTATAPAVANTAITVGPMDASSLADGPIELIVTMANGATTLDTSYGSVLFKDTMPPAMPTAFELLAGAGNASGMVNLANVAAADFAVTFDASADAQDLVSVFADDGANLVTSPAANVQPSGVVAIGGVDMSSLMDGSLTLRAEVVDPAANSTVFQISGSKDTEIAGILLARVATTPPQPANTVTAGNVVATNVQVSVDVNAVTGDAIALTVQDSTGAFVSAPAENAPVGGGALVFGPLDLSNLADGPITLELVISDASGNVVTDSSHTATKVANNTAVTDAHVMSGPDNAQDVINVASSREVYVEIQAAEPFIDDRGEMIQVVLDDGQGGQVASGFVATAVGQESMIIGPFNASALADGSYNLMVEISDDAGNVVRADASSGIIDLAVPAAPNAFFVAATGSNPADWVNGLSQTAVEIRISIPSHADDWNCELRVSDGATTISNQFVHAGGAPNFVIMTGDYSALADGPLVLELDLVDGAGNKTTAQGRQATKDTVAVLPTSAFVAAGAGNAMDVINVSSASSTAVNVVLPAGSSPTESYRVLLQGGGNTVLSATKSGASGQTLSFPALDTSSLPDGLVSIAVLVSDQAGNSVMQPMSSAQKDATAPGAPSQAFVTAGPTNPAHVINADSHTTVGVSVTMGAGSNPADRFTVYLSDGTATTAIPETSAPKSGTTASYLLDASGLGDGPVGVYVQITDAAGNATSFIGHKAVKDTSVVAASAAGVDAGADNAADVINATNVSSVSVTATMPAATVGDERVHVRLSDGVTNVDSAQMQASTGGGSMTFSVDASALADGSISVTVFVEETANGNLSVVAGSPATKDTVLPGMIDTVTIPASGTAPQGYVNGDTADSVTIQAAYGSQFDGSEQIDFVIEDAAGSSLSLGSHVPNGAGGMAAFAGQDLRALAEGSLALRVTVTDLSGNQTEQVFALGTKDTQDPEVIVAFQFEDGHGTPYTAINSANDSQVGLSAPFEANHTEGDRLQVTFSDGTNSMTMPPVAYNAVDGQWQLGPWDLSGLADGTITISGSLRDFAGNQNDFTANSIAKDATLAAITAANVAGGASNAMDEINDASKSAVVIDVSFAASSSRYDEVRVLVDDGVTTVTSPWRLASEGVGTTSFGPVDLSALADGSISLTVEQRDDAGNMVSTAGTTATKDTVAPAQPTAAKVVATMVNPDHYVNIASETSVSVELVFPATSNADDVATVTLSDGSATATGTVNAPGGGGTVTATGIDTSALAEGAVTLSVAMTDGTDNTSGPFAGSSATKDITAPTTLFVNPVTTPWSGSSQVVSGLADANIDVVVDGGSAQATGVADNNGYFSVTVSLTASATNSLSVYSRDVAGNPSTTATTDGYVSQSLDVVQNPAAPAAPFSDATVALGLGSTGAADGGAFADFDNDGDLDLFVGQAGAGIMYQYDSMTGTYTDVTGSLGVTFAGDRSAVWGDYDNDGDQDLLTVDSVVGTRLYRNDIVGLGTMTFTDDTVAEGAGIALTTLTQAFWLDHDNDGWLDFLVLDGTMNNNFLMSNQRGAMVPMNSFVQDATTGIDNNVLASMSGAVADFDADGDVDVIFGDSTPGLFYRNDAATSFTNIAGVTSNVSFDHSAGPRGIVFADYDNDGDFDIFIARGGALNVNQLWRNDGGSSFTEVAALAGIDADVSADDVCFGDIDNDGILDLYVGADAGNKLYRGLGDTNMDNVWEFTEIASDLGVGVDDANDAGFVQMADIDDDGDLDIFVANDGAADVLYRNDLNNYNYLKVTITGQGAGVGSSSTDALGAVVYLKDSMGNILASRQVCGGRGQGSQDVRELHFGGVTPFSNCFIEIRYPSGVVNGYQFAPNVWGMHFTESE